MRFLYLFIYHFMLLELFHLNCINAATNTTTLQPPLERMLSRKKRFLLMPKGCHLKFTGQLSKRLIAAFPRGFNFVMEMALYYPAPTTRQDVIPKRLRKPTTTTPKPKGTKPPIFVCVPGSLICWKAKPAIKPMKVQRIDENVNGNIQWIEPQQYKQIYQNYTQYYAKPQQWSQYSNPQQWSRYNNPQQWAKYSSPQQYERYKWRPGNHGQTPLQYYRQKYAPQTNWAKYKTYNVSAAPNQKTYNHWYKPRYQQYQTQIKKQRWRRSLMRANLYLSDFVDDDPLRNTEYIHFPDLEPHLDWSHYQSHRDRRQLFHQFEGLSSLLGFDMKSCLLRAICESKRYLLPPGYSLIQDVLRIVFTLPTTSGLEDDYSRAMRADYETCDKFLKPKCAFNILNWFLNPVKGQ